MRRRKLLAVLAAAAAIGPARGRAQTQPVIVFAAASLKDALDAIVAQWRRQTGARTVVSYAGSSALARQIEAGAPADLFISADLAWMDYLDKRGLIRNGSRIDLLGNRLVLIAPKASAVSAPLGPGFPIAAALGGGRLAIADPAAVPAGRYGKAALENLSLWDEVKNRLAPTADVRAALALVARGEAPLGIVYRTDAAAEPRVGIIGSFPESTHPPIVYPMALTARAGGPDAARFAAYLRGPAAGAVFTKWGFTVIAAPG